MLAGVICNSWLYVATTANPLVSSDAWNFLEEFVPRALNGSVGLADFYAKRDALDHAQPLNKLWLLINARYLGLDFMFEAVVGMLCAIAGVAVMKRAADVEAPASRGSRYWLPLVALAAVYLSLNSSVVLSWPLVTFGFVTTLIALLTCAVAWKAWLRNSAGWFGLAMALCAVTTDDSAILLAAALVPAFLWAGFRTGRLADGVKFAVVGIASVVAYHVLYNALYPTAAIPGSASPIDVLGRLAAHLGGPEGWRVLAIFASGVAFFGQLQGFFGPTWETAQIVLGLIVLAGHGIYWFTILRSRPGPASFMSMALMLLGYAFVAGILYGRVPDGGLAYLNQPRYAFIYQLQIVAFLLLMLARPKTDENKPVARGASVLVAGALLAVQIPLSAHSWDEARYNRHYWRQMAGQMAQLGRDPTAAPQICADNLVVCKWEPERRARVVRLLMAYRLNAFSATFRARHHFED